MFIRSNNFVQSVYKAQLNIYEYSTAAYVNRFSLNVNHIKKSNDEITIVIVNIF